MIVYILICAAIVAADLLVKNWAVTNLMGEASIDLLHGVFRLSYVENRGAAFSLLEGKRVFFIVLTLAAFAVMIWAFCKNVFKGVWGKTTLTFIFAGALGNFIDRLFQGYVVDMFDFYLIDFPVFNVADIFLTVGAIMGIVYILFIDKELLKDKKKNESDKD